MVIPGTVTEIEPSAFEHTAWLQNWERSGSGDFLIVGDGILLDYRGTAPGVAGVENGVCLSGPRTGGEYPVDG